MRRGVLINRSHRQHALVHSILGHQPLVARLTRQQQLLQALGLPGLPGLPVSQTLLVSPALTSAMPAFPTTDSSFRTALAIQQGDDGEAKVEALPLANQVYEASIPAQPLTTAMVVQQETPVQQQPVASQQEQLRAETALQETGQQAGTLQIAAPKADKVGETGRMHARQQREKVTANQLSTPGRHQDSVRSQVEAGARSIAPSTEIEQQAAASVEILVPVPGPVNVELEGKVVLEDEIVAEDIAEAGGVEPSSASEAEIVAESTDISKVEFVGVSPAQTGDEAVPEVKIPAEREDRRETGIEAELESLTEQQEDGQPQASHDAAEAAIVQPLLEDGHGSTGEAAQPRQYDDAGRQVEQLTTDEAASVRVAEGAKSPIETVRPRHPRRSIEELTAQAGHRSPSTAPTKKEPEEPQRTVQAAKGYSQPDTKPGTRREDEVHADELFAPANTDRSPQAWLARLMGKSVPVQEEVASDVEIAPGQDLPAESRESEAPSNEKSSLPLSKQRGERSIEAEGQGQKQGQAKAVPVTRFDTAESIATGERQVFTSDPHRRRGNLQGRPLPTARAHRQSHGSTSEPGQLLRSWPRATLKVAPTASRPFPQKLDAHSIAPVSEAQIETANARRAVPGMAGMTGAARTMQARQPEQLSSRTRRFLRPLLGIDPASIQLHRDAQATQLADAYSADAVTMADAVELPASNASETPETLGLLAHELTHVARQRAPGFVPPILQTQQDVGGGSGSYIVRPPLAGGLQGGVEQNLVTADEEALALQVERQVRQVAREQVRQEGIILPPAQDVASPLSSMPGAPSDALKMRRAVRDPWGGLPAPWEPLPGWLTTPVPSNPAEQSVSSSPAPASMPALTLFEAQGMASNDGNSQANGTAETGVQRAGRERSIGEDTIPSASSSREAQAPEPDLDELARQVYSILRNRLEVERRRHG